MTLTAQPDAFEERIIVSPELALVDPELAAAARMLPPDPGRPEPVRETWSAVAASVHASEQALAAPQPAPKPASRIRTRRFRAVAATAVAALAAGALGLVPAAGNRGADATLAGPHGGPSELRTQAARQARAARIYTWPAVPGAHAYVFKIARGAQAVFETTTADRELELPARLHLSPGHYRWSVTPRFARRSAASTARPVVEATFLVARS